MIYDTQQANKSRNFDEFGQTIERIQSNAGYAKSLLDTCTNPGKLDISDQAVLTAEKEKAVEDYLKGGQEVATNAELNWITTLVFMIPCIQVKYIAIM